MVDQATQQMVVGASPARTWDVLTDFARYPVWAHDLKSAEVLEQDAEGRGLLVAYRVGAMGRSKGSSGLLIKGCADGRHEGHRVDRRRGRVITEVHLVMDVWSAGVAATAGDADDIAGVDLLSFVDVRLDELMAVPGDDPAGVVDVDVPAAACGEVGVAVAVAAPVAAGTNVDGVAPHPADGAGGGGVDRGAFGYDQVDSVVGGPIRRAEPGADLAVHRLGPALGADRHGAGGQAGADPGERACRFRVIMSTAEHGAVPVMGGSSTDKRRAVY